MGLKQKLSKLALPLIFHYLYHTITHFPLHKPELLNKQSLLSLSPSLPHKHTVKKSEFFHCLNSETETMKQKTVSYALLLFIFLITSSQISAGRFLANKQGKEDEVKLENGTSTEIINPESTDSLEKLMGLEKCEKTDEECMKRRVVAEAHLDYIYTQQHNP